MLQLCILFYFFCLIEISVIDPAEYKLPSIREMCICMLVYKYENEVLKLLLIVLLLLLKIFKEGGPSAAAVFQEALHLNT